VFKIETMMLLFAVITLAFAQYTVTGQIRNEFGDAMTLSASKLFSGSWVSPPLQTIAVSTSYVDVFKAAGSGVQGQIVYTSSRSTSTFFFQDDSTGVIYNATVSPPPWIGGLGTKTINGYAATLQYWTHQMCTDSRNSNCALVAPCN